MDTTTVTSPQVRAWELLTGLAEYGRSGGGAMQDLVRRIAELAREHLPCPWGVVAVQSADATASAGWGIPQERQQRLAARTISVPEQTIELPLYHLDEPAGMLLLGVPAAEHEQLAPGFLTTLRNQIELLIALQRRETAQQLRARELFVLYENADALATAAPLDRALARLAENSALALNVDCCGIFLRDPTDPNVLVEAGAYGGEAGCVLPARIALVQAPLIAQALDSDQPRVFERDAGGALRLFRWTSALFAPLRIGDRTIGLLGVGVVNRAHRFSRSEINLAQTLAAQVSTAVVNTRLALAEQRHAGAIDTLRAISAQLAAGLPPDQLAQAIVEGACRLAPCAAVALSLIDPETLSLQPAYSTGIALDATSPTPFSDSPGLGAWVARHRSSLRLADLRQAPVRPTIAALVDGEPISSYLAAPLQVSEQLLGVIELFDTQAGRFNENDEHLVTILAAHAAQAIVSTRRYVQADEHLQTRLLQLRSLQRISRELTATLYLHNILGFALKESLRATRATTGYVALRGYEARREAFEMEQSEALGVTPSPQFHIALRAVDHNGPIRLVAAEGYSAEEYERLLNTEITAGHTIAEEVAARGEPLVADELSGDDRPAAVGPLPAATLAAPIYYEAQVIGVVNLHSPQARAFDRDALDFIRAVADQIALAIGNEERYYEQRRQRDLLAQRANTLNEVLRIGQEMRADRSLDDVLEQIAFSAVETARFRSVVFYLLNADDGATATLVAAAGLPLVEIERLRSGTLPMALIDQLLDRRFRIGRSFFVPGAALRELSSEIDLRLLSTVESEGERAPHEWQADDTLIVPLYSTRARLVGIMVADEPYDRQRPTLRSVETLEIFADQAAIAIENASLLREARSQAEQMTSLYRASTAMAASLDLGSLLDRIYDEIVERMGVPSFCFVASYHPARDEIRFEMFKREGVTLERLQHKTMPRSGLAGWVIEHGEILYIGDYQEEEQRLPVPPIKLGEPVRSWVGIPLMSQNQAIGVLSVQSFEPRAFSARDVQWLSTVSNQLAVALSNIRLFTEARDSAAALQRKVGELSTLLRAAQVLSSSLKPADVLHTLMAVVAEQLQVNTVALWKIADDGFLTPAAMQGISPDVARTLRVPVGRGLTGRVAADGRPLVVTNVEDEGSSLYPQFNRDNQYTSFMGVPVVYREQTIGVLSVMTVQEREFSPDEVTLLAGMAYQAAIALENARLFAEREQRIAELTALNHISQAINVSLSTDEILVALHRGMSEVLDTSQSFIALYDAETRRLSYPLVYVDGQRSAEEEAEVIIVDEAIGLTPTVIVERRPLLLRSQQEVDAISTTRYAPGEPPICSWLGVPIIQGDDVFGVLNVQSYEAGKFDEDSLRFLMTMANQAAIALSNVRLFQSEQARRRAADTLREVAQTLTGVLALDEIFSLILDQLARVVPYDTASLMLREGDILRVAAARGFEETLQSRVEQLALPIDADASLARVVHSRRPLVLADAREAPASSVDEGTEHIRGWIGAPLLLGDDVIGVLNVDSATVGAYDDEDAQLAFALASQAAQAIRNARLFAEVRRFTAELEKLVDDRTAALQDANAQLAAEKDRLQAVHTITLELTASLDLQTTLNRALELASAAVGARRGSIMLHDPQANRLTCRAVLNSDGSVETKSFPISFEKGLGLSGWVMRHQEAVCIADVRGDDRWLREEGRAEEVRSVIAAPLMTQDGPLGVLILSSPRVNFFSQDQVQLLATIANEVAIVIHNATLYTVINEIAMERGELWAQQREENSKNQAILQSLGEGVIVVDEQQRVVLYNAAAEQILGIPASYVAGQSLARIAEYRDPGAVPDRAAQIYDGLQHGLRILADEGKNHNRMLELPAPAQSIVLNFAPWLGPRDTVFGSVLVLRDITREVEADRAKRDFISSVSHELRTPLTSIKGYVDLLLLGAGGQLSEGQLSFLSVVKNNANRLMELINDILEIGRIDSDKIQLSFEDVTIGNVFQDVLQTLRAEIERKRLAVSVQIDDAVPPIIADPRRLTQVVLNLASNAVKYTYPEGEIALRAALNPAGLLQVDVIDNGVGITPEQQQNLFRRFYRADNPLRDEAGGTGLGLSIARSLIELHGGEMWVESEVGKGSTFSFIIPLTQPEAEPVSEPAGQGQP